MTASFCTVSSFSGNDIVKHFCVTVSSQRITSLAAFLAVSKHLKISESSFQILGFLPRKKTPFKTFYNMMFLIF